jgi:secreted trypsin-like serine protease
MKRLRAAIVFAATLAALPVFANLTPPTAGTPLLVASGDPEDIRVPATDSFLDGVAKLVITRTDGTFGCSGALVGNGQHVLTAAHCLTGSSAALQAIGATVSFPQASGAPSRSAAQFFVHPSWTGDIADGGDLAILVLSQPAPGQVTRYDILRDHSITGGFTATLAGFGVSGTGTNGYAAGSYPFGTLRSGLNRFDTVWDLAGHPFAFDFDNGTVAQDAIGQLTAGPGGYATSPFRDTGVGAMEVMVGPGDSGGPSFLGALLAGIHSFGATAGPPIDLGDTFVNGQFGELGGDTRVAFYADWVDGVVAVPEPSTYAMMLAGVLAVWVATRRFACLALR